MSGPIRVSVRPDGDDGNTEITISGLPMGIDLLDVLFKQQLGDPLTEIANSIERLADAMSDVAAAIRERGVS